MIESRQLSELLPIVSILASQAIAETEKLTGLQIIITCTYRDDEMQAKYYAQGRTTPGIKITNDKGPGAPHSRRIALDIAPAVKDENGKVRLYYETHEWVTIADCFKRRGFSWGGDFRSIKDKPHFQYMLKDF